jgi:hypothetical protein
MAQHRKVQLGLRLFFLGCNRCLTFGRLQRYTTSYPRLGYSYWASLYPPSSTPRYLDASVNDPLDPVAGTLGYSVGILRFTEVKRTLSIECKGPCDGVGRPVVVDGLARGAPRRPKRRTRSRTVKQAAKLTARIDAIGIPRPYTGSPRQAERNSNGHKSIYAATYTASDFKMGEIEMS